MIIHADCVEAMQAMEPDSVDAIVCDPPYGLEFMGKEWDRLAPDAPNAAAWRGRRATSPIEKETSDEPRAEDNPWQKESTGYRGHQRPKAKRCRGCGRREFSGTPCECVEPDWEVVYPPGPPSGQIAAQRWHQAWATEALRVLKPGGHLLAFGGTRTYHRLACAVEDAGFEIRDSLIWIYGSGFPKSLDVSKAIDKAAGAEREVVGEARRKWTGSDWSREKQAAGGYRPEGEPYPKEVDAEGAYDLTAPATPEAQHWQGWGTAMKPSHEPIVVARKPLVGTVAANVLEHGTGALNIDGCRIESGGEHKRPFQPTNNGRNVYGEQTGFEPTNAEGRWPPNLTLSHLPECKQTGTRKVSSNARNDKGSVAGMGYHGGSSQSVAWGHADSDGTETIPEYRCAENCPVAELDRQSGELKSGDLLAGHKQGGGEGYGYGDGTIQRNYGGDTGGASRFFYVAKASRAERNAGLEGFEERAKPVQIQQSAGRQLEGQAEAMPAANVHPTVKPIALMRWLVRLVTPKGGTVLDPFTGSGSTGVAAVLEGFEFVGIEREAEYVALAEARVKFWAQFPGADVDKVLLSDAKAREIEASGQLGLL